MQHLETLVARVGVTTDRQQVYVPMPDPGNLPTKHPELTLLIPTNSSKTLEREREREAGFLAEVTNLVDRGSQVGQAVRDNFSDCSIDQTHLSRCNR